MANFVVPSWRPLHHSRHTLRAMPVRASTRGPPRPEEQGPRGRKVEEEDMNVLRKQMLVGKIADGDCNGNDGRWKAVRAEWYSTEWERKYHEIVYTGNVCDAMAMLQRWLLRGRPGLTVGLISLLLVGVPASTVLVVANLVEVAQTLVSAATAAACLN